MASISTGVALIGTSVSSQSSQSTGVTQINQQINTGVSGFVIQFTTSQTGALLTVTAPSASPNSLITLGSPQVNFWPPGASTSTQASKNASGQFVIPRTSGDSGLYLVQVFMQATITPLAPSTSVVLPTTFCIMGCDPSTNNGTNYQIGMTGLAIFSTTSSDSTSLAITVQLQGGG